MKHIAWMLLTMLVSSPAIAQKNLDPTPEDIQLAKKLREQYPKDDVAILSSTDIVKFGVSNNGKLVTATNKIQQKLMNINHRADIQKFEFYDSESIIETFQVKYRNDKSANLQVKDEFYKDSDLFYNDARVKYVNVDFPVQGYTYNYEVDKKYNDVKYFTSIYFNAEYPVLDKTVTIHVPGWLDLEVKEFNFEGHSITKSVNKSGNVNIYTYQMKNIPSFYKEENASGKSYIYPHILLLAKSFTNQGTTTKLFNSNADLYKWYKSLVDMVKDDPSVFKEKVEELTAGAKSDIEKVRNIYYWVQDNIRYIAFEDGIAGFKPDESQNVFTKRYGDCKGMANLIKQMLKVAGFDARLTWIGTKHLAYDYNTPSLAVDNHMICSLTLNGKKYFLDGTEKFMPLGSNAERIQNKEVLIENGDKFIIDKVPADNHEKNIETYSAVLSVDKEKLTGTCSKTFSGESCSGFLYTVDQLPNQNKKLALERFLSQSDKNISVSDVVTSDMSNREQLLKLDYQVSVSNKVSSFDDEMYVDLELFKEYSELDLKERVIDYEMDHKTNYRSTVSVKLPSGYKVSKLPENIDFAGKDFQVKVTYTQTAKEIICNKTFIFEKGVIKSGSFNDWNEVAKSLKTIYNQPIVFTKS